MNRSAGTLPPGGAGDEHDQRLRLEAALREAYAPLLRSRTVLSPARVRATVRWAPASPPPLRGAALLGRAGELATAVAAAAFVFAATLSPLVPPGSPVPPAGTVEEVRVAPGLSLERPEIFARWLRVGRSVAANDLLDPLVGVGEVFATDSDAPPG
ncbi:MAG TPA: hypothetical protein VM070_08575, partial [Candidatus Saccharimonadales bacterium]|nr:hypothetical protein [Candidatus Saccharimonadales bacterium]